MSCSHRVPIRTPAGAVSGCLHLVLISGMRMVKSRQSMVSVMLLGFAVMVAIAWSLRRDREPAEMVEQVVLPVYVTFLLPVFCLCYGTASIAGERSEGTLVYLLTTPLPRAAVYGAKYASALLLAQAWAVGGLVLLCLVAGPCGAEVLRRIWPLVAEATWAYVGLFHLFSALFRRATIVALAYALFLETLLGNMPGMVKRIAIQFYTQCLLFDAAAPFGVGPTGPHHPDMFAPVTARAAVVVLGFLAVVFPLIGALVFVRREYTS